MINKIVYRTLLLAGALAALSQQAGAQTAEGGALAARDVTVENLKVTRAEGSLVVDFDLNLSRLDLPVNSRLVFTPVVQRRDEVRAWGPSLSTAAGRTSRSAVPSTRIILTMPLRAPPQRYGAVRTLQRRGAL